jgi:hypothetical protein
MSLLNRVKYNLIISLIILFLFIANTGVYREIDSETYDYGFPFPYYRSFEGKSDDPSIVRHHFFLFNCFLNLLILIAMVVMANVFFKYYQNWRSAKRR